MEKKDYKRIVDSNKPKETRVANSVIAFLVGGFMGVFAVLLSDFYEIVFDVSTKDANSFMLLTFIILACLFTALGFFDKLVSIFRCGLIIPITGFAHSMMSAGMEYRKEGLVTGIGSNAFKLAGSVILYGVVAAWFFGTIRYILGVM